jgi:hypothetical protein
MCCLLRCHHRACDGGGLIASGLQMCRLKGIDGWCLESSEVAVVSPRRRCLDAVVSKKTNSVSGVHGIMTARLPLSPRTRLVDGL